MSLAARARRQQGPAAMRLAILFPLAVLAPVAACVDAPPGQALYPASGSLALRSAAIEYEKAPEPVDLPDPAETAARPPGAFLGGGRLGPETPLALDRPGALGPGGVRSGQVYDPAARIDPARSFDPARAYDPVRRMEAPGTGASEFMNPPLPRPDLPPPRR